jgi:hypothetical protein
MSNWLPKARWSKAPLSKGRSCGCWLNLPFTYWTSPLSMVYPRNALLFSRNRWNRTLLVRSDSSIVGLLAIPRWSSALRANSSAASRKSCSFSLESFSGRILKFARWARLRAKQAFYVLMVICFRVERIFSVFKKSRTVRCRNSTLGIVVASLRLTSRDLQQTFGSPVDSPSSIILTGLNFC